MLSLRHDGKQTGARRGFPGHPVQVQDIAPQQCPVCFGGPEAHLEGQLLCTPDFVPHVSDALLNIAHAYPSPVPTRSLSQNIDEQSKWYCHLIKGTSTNSPALRKPSANPSCGGTIKMAPAPPGPPSAFCRRLPLLMLLTRISSCSKSGLKG
jgi:hypothetical protein